MLKKIALAVLLACFITASAQAAPIWCYTNYVKSAGMSTTYWAYSNGAYRETNLLSPCGSEFNPSKMQAAALTVPHAQVSQQFTTDPDASSSWSMAFVVQTPSFAGATFWDVIRVQVEDINTGQSEYFYVHALNLTRSCQTIDLTMSRDYTGHQVRVTFRAQSLSNLDMYVSTVSFWGQYCE